MPRSRTVLSLFFLDPRKFGAIEEYCVFLARALHSKGWRCVLAFKNPVKEPVLSEFAGTNAILEVLDTRSRLRLFFSLRRLLWKYRPDVVHFHFVTAFSLQSLMVGLSMCPRVIFSERVSLPQTLPTFSKIKHRIWDRLILALLGVEVVAVSNHIKKVLVDCYQMSAQRIRVIWNGVNPGRFVPVEPERVANLRSEMGIEPDSSVVLCVANLRPEKGVEDFLKCAKQSLVSLPKALFLVTGEGPLDTELRQLARDLRIEDRLRFTGLRSDVQRLMAIADVIVVPSLREAAGFTVIEAMASGRPVVATRVGGVPEYLDDGVTGVLVQPNAPDQLSRAVVDVLTSPTKAASFGKAGRIRVEAQFSMERWIRDTCDLYGVSAESCKGKTDKSNSN